MAIIAIICAFVVIFAYEIRHRMVNEQLVFLNNETQRLDLEVKKLKEELTKKQDVEIKKGFKLPFFPGLK